MDDNDVKESWEDWEDLPVSDLLKKEPSKWDEDVDDNEPAPTPKVEPPPAKVPKKVAGKSGKNKGKPVEAEKLRLVEEANYKATVEFLAKKKLFAKKGDERTLDNFIPKTENDFLEYGELVSYKLRRPYEKSFHYIGLLKAVMRLSMTILKESDAKEVTSAVTAIANKKIKAEANACNRVFYFDFSRFDGASYIDFIETVCDGVCVKYTHGELAGQYKKCQGFRFLERQDSSAKKKMLIELCIGFQLKKLGNEIEECNMKLFVLKDNFYLVRFKKGRKWYRLKDVTVLDEVEPLDCICNYNDIEQEGKTITDVFVGETALRSALHTLWMADPTNRKFYC